MLQTISREYPTTGIHGRVVHELGKDIVRGVFKPGERLPNETVFIERFHGSRTAIREALRVLSAKGLLEARQRAGTHVRLQQYWNLCDPDVLSWHDPTALEEKKVRNLSELRRLIEPEAAKLFTQNNVTDTDLEQMLISLRQMERADQAGDVVKLHELRVSFHMFLMERCGNEYLRTQANVVKLVLDYHYNRHRLEGAVADFNLRWYYLIFDKIRNGDVEAAVSAVRSLAVRDHEAILDLQNEKTRVVA
ncbi:MAG: FadR family transcriptional regulator [Sneathiella sp.]|nr:FadR family transcriptional regulator [Sneathiella sp.]